MQPDKNAILQHLQLLFGHLDNYCDGRIEIRYTPPHSRGLTQNEWFLQDELEHAAEFVARINAVEGQNAYVLASLATPESAPFGHMRDEDTYVTPYAWADIDRPDATADAIRATYSKCEPSFVVVTGRTPHIRMHLWFRHEDPIQDTDTVREVNTGLIHAFKSDPAVYNPARPMRIAGTIAWPKKDGRTPEIVELHVKDTSRAYIVEQLLQNYPVPQDYTPDYSFNNTGEQVQQHAGGLDPRLVDGREKYMNNMVYASIINLTREKGDWPTPEDVFDNVWPVYSTHVAARNGRTLEQDERGEKAVQQKIKSKLRLFKQGAMARYGHGSIEDIKANAKKNTHVAATFDPTPQEEYDPETGEVIETKKEGIQWIKFNDIQADLTAMDIVQGLLGYRQMSITYGESNCGKTFFMTSLLFHVAYGLKWREKRVNRGGIVYVALESPAGIKKRTEALKRQYEAHGKDVPFVMITSHIDMFNPDGNIKEFIQTLKEIENEIGKIDIVCIDTLARAMTGGDENSGQDMGVLVRHGEIIRDELDTHINFVHHSGKDKTRGMRGSSVLKGAIDTEIEVAREDEKQDFSVVSVKKQRDLEKIDDFAFFLNPVVLGQNQYGEDVTTCQVIYLDEIPQGDVAGTSLTPREDIAYSAVCNAMISRGQTVGLHQGQAQRKVISYLDFNIELEKLGWFTAQEDLSSEKTKKMTNSVRSSLRKKNKIGYNDHYIWIIQ